MILLAAYTHNLQINVYARNQKLFCRSKYRQKARNRPQIKPVAFTKQGRKGQIFKAIGVLNIGFVYTYIITLYSQAYLEPPLLITTIYLYIFSLQYTPKLLNLLLINSRNRQQYSRSQSRYRSQFRQGRIQAIQSASSTIRSFIYSIQRRSRRVSFTPLIKNAVLLLYCPNCLLLLSYFRGILAILAARQEGVLGIVSRQSSSLAPYRTILSSRT